MKFQKHCDRTCFGFVESWLLCCLWSYRTNYQALHPCMNCPQKCCLIYGYNYSFKYPLFMLYMCIINIVEEQKRGNVLFLFFYTTRGFPNMINIYILRNDHLIYYITLDTRKSYTALYLFVKTLVKITALKKHFSFFLILCYEIWNAKKKPTKVWMLYWYWNNISLAFFFYFCKVVSQFLVKQTDRQCISKLERI